MRSNRTPDLAIEVFHNNRPEFVLILDAKYKHDAGMPLDEDLSKMENYVHSIAYRSHASERMRALDVMALVMYPGTQLDYQPNLATGALPLTPGGSPETRTTEREQFKHVLHDILADCGALS